MWNANRCRLPECCIAPADSGERAVSRHGRAPRFALLAAAERRFPCRQHVSSTWLEIGPGSSRGIYGSGSFVPSAPKSWP